MTMEGMLGVVGGTMGLLTGKRIWKHTKNNALILRELSRFIQYEKKYEKLFTKCYNVYGLIIDHGQLQFFPPGFSILSGVEILYFGTKLFLSFFVKKD